MSELFTRKNINKEFFTKDDLKTSKKILTMTNAHLTKYQRDGNINITRGEEFRDYHCAPLCETEGLRGRSALRRKWKKY